MHRTIKNGGLRMWKEVVVVFKFSQNICYMLWEESKENSDLYKLCLELDVNQDGVAVTF
jgi:hypothetical protein